MNRGRMNDSRAVTQGWVAVAGAIACACSTAGCATIFRGSEQAIWVSSDPPFAKINIQSGNERRVFATTDTGPTEIILQRNRQYAVGVIKEGYVPKAPRLTRDVSIGWVAVSAIGLLGIFVDAATGALLTFEPQHIHVVLEPEAKRMGRDAK